MKLICLIPLFLIASAYAQGDSSSTGGNTPVTDTSTPAPPPTTTQPPPPTTAPITTPSTPPSTSASPEPTTQPPPTSAPTSPPSAPTGTASVTSPAPPTTTPPPPSPTGPTPYVDINPPTAYAYGLVDQNNKTCVMVNVAIKFNITFNDTNKQLRYTEFSFDNTTVVSDSSECITGSFQPITLQFSTFNLTMNFQSDPDDQYGLVNMTLDFSLKNDVYFPNIDPSYGVSASIQTNNLDGSSNSDYRINNQGSYRCDNTVRIPFFMSTEVEEQFADGFFSEFKYQAFGFKTNGTYGTYEECEDDFGTTDIVPIAVGCALAALVVIVLIAYLIGRRRSRQKGYQSV